MPSDQENQTIMSASVPVAGLRLVRPLAALLILVAAAGFLGSAVTLSPYTMDDSYITFRYASHWAEGHGLVWNVGENRPTEGYTSFSWMALLAGASVLGFELEPLAKAVGVILMLALSGLIAVGVWRRPQSALTVVAAALAAWLFLLNTFLSLHAVSGMETALALFVMTSFFLVLHEFLSAPDRARGLALGGLAFLCGVTRPEANLTVTVALAAALVITRERKTLLLYSGAPYFVLGMIYFLWRWNYYGLFFPLPFYIKQSGGKRLGGIFQVYGFLRDLWIFYPGFLGFIIGFRRNRLWIPAALAVTVNLAYFITPTHIMGTGFRFLVPMLPALAIFSGLGYAFLSDILSRRAGLLAALAVLLAVAAVDGALEVRHFIAWRSVPLGYSRSLEQSHASLGRALKPLGPDRTLAIWDAGAVPYFSGWKAIDNLGLNNPEVALSIRTGFRPELVLDHSPDLLVLISNSKDEFVSPLFRDHEKLLGKEAVARGYRKLGCMEHNANYYLWLFARDPDFSSRLLEVLRPLPAFRP